MSKTLEKISQTLDNLTETVGMLVSLLLLAIITVVSTEMVLRFVFNKPTPWAHELSSWLQVAVVFLGGAYAFNKGQFVRIDILRIRMRPKMKALIDITVGSILLGLFSGVLIWKGADLAWQSFQMGEISATGAWSGPVFIPKMFVPLGGLLLLIAWISHILKQIVILNQGD